MNNYESNKKLMELLEKYNLNNQEKEELLQTIKPIFLHDEFQRRMTDEYLHHDRITLGEHILEDTVVTYMLSKKYKDNLNYDTTVALKIAMFHDLYTLPWQNNPEARENHFYNKHGFRHPIEAVINADVWFPEIFNNSEEAYKIIDGIVHHMFPLPVRIFSGNEENDSELKNFNYVKNLNLCSKDILIQSSNKMKIGPFSITRSQYKEGLVLSKADKIVSMSNFKKSSNLYGLMALLHGHNKNLESDEIDKKK